MGSRRVALLGLLFLGACVAIAVLFGGERSPEERAPRTPDAAPKADASAARLTGRAPAEATRASAAPLLAAATSDDPAIRADAIPRLRARLKAGDLTLDEILQIALLPATDGPMGLLRQRALKDLTERGPGTLPLLGRLLDLLESDEEHERSVSASVVRSLCGATGIGPLVAFPDGEDATSTPTLEALRPFLPRIEALIRQEDTREAVLPLLHVLGSEAGSSAPALIEWIQDIMGSREEFRRSNPNVHVSWHHQEFQIAEVLSAMGAAALPEILDALAEEDPHGEYSLHMAIREMGPDAQDALKELLTHEDPDIRAEALVAVAGNAKGEAETLEILRRALQDPHADVREAAVGQLDDFGADAGPDLLAALSDPDDDVRAAAARELAAVPEAAAAALPTLLAMLASDDYGERLSTLMTLAKIGPAAAAAAPHVLALRADDLESDHLRDMFGDMFRNTITAFGPEAVPAVIAAAGGTDEKLRRAAVDVLLLWEDVSAEDVAPLAGVLPGLEGADRLRLAALLARHDHPVATRTLVAGLTSDDRATQAAAAEGLQHAGPEAVASLPLLVAGLRENHAKLHADGANWSREWDPYYAFYQAVSHVGSLAPAALLPALADENEDVVEAAARGVAQAGAAGVAMLEAHWSEISPRGRALLVGPLVVAACAETPSETARVLLTGALADSDPAVRLAAARASCPNPAFFEPAVETYLDLLSAPEGSVAQDAAYRLRQLGAKLAPWEEALKAAQRQAESTARRWVQDVLDQIEDAR